MNKCEISPKNTVKNMAVLAKKPVFYSNGENEILFEKYLERFRDL